MALKSIDFSAICAILVNDPRYMRYSVWNQCPRYLVRSGFDGLEIQYFGL